MSKRRKSFCRLNVNIESDFRWSIERLGRNFPCYYQRLSVRLPESSLHVQQMTAHDSLKASLNIVHPHLLSPTLKSSSSFAFLLYFATSPDNLMIDFSPYLNLRYNENFRWTTTVNYFNDYLVLQVKYFYINLPSIYFCTMTLWPRDYRNVSVRCN